MLKNSLLLLPLLLLTGCQPGNNPDDRPDALLQLLGPEDTGITFSNDLREDEALNILTFEYFYNGAGVGIGDVNNDSLPDLFFTANMTQSRLYLNRGKLRFEDATAQSGINTQGKWATGVSMVDINSDGWLDIHLCFAGPHDASRRANAFYINNGDGTFTDKAPDMGLADTSHSTQAAFLDYDRDGDLDLYLLNNITGRTGPNVIRPKMTRGEHPSTDRLYRNDGGRFVNVSAQAGILQEGYGLGVSICDLNLDGWPDVYVSNDYLSNDLLYLNNRDGTFSDHAGDCFRHTSYSSMGNDVADINNDGLPDLVAVDMLPPDNFRRKLMFASINYDRFRSEIISGYFPQYMRNTLQLHQGLSPEGMPVFSEIGQLAGIHSTDWSWSPLFCDLDNDGWKDLLVTNGYPRDITNLDFAAYKMNTLMQEHYTQGSQHSLLKALEQIEGALLPNYVFKNNRDLSFRDVSAAWGFTQSAFSHGAAVGDLDRDGDLDYVVSNTNQPAFVYENKSSSQGWLRVGLQGKTGNPGGFGARVEVYAGDKRQVQELQPCRGYQSSVEPVLHFGLGTADRVDSLRVTWPDGASQLLKDIPAAKVLLLEQQQAQAAGKQQRKTGGKPLLADITPASGLAWRHEEPHYADFKVQPLLPHKHSQLGPFLAGGDVNADGLGDFFVGGAFRQVGQLAIQQRDGSFRLKPLESGKNYEEDGGSLFFDADQDGDLDLYVTSGSSEFPEGSPYYQDRLYRNDGKGNFSRDSAALPPMRSSTASVAAGDYDGDGDLDLFVGGRIVPARYTEVPQSYLLENRGGRFEDVADKFNAGLSRAGRVSAALWTDVDGDERLDLLLAGEWMPLTLYKNKGGSFERQEIPGTAGWWNCLAAGDLDRDGDPDFVGGNLGRNHPYLVSDSTPLRLYSYDFNASGRKEAVMTYYLQGQEVPVHFRNDLLNRLPGLKTRYTDYSSYARADWSSIFQASVREQAERIAVSDFSSVWLENRDGVLLVHALPVEAQLAPVHGILVHDFNADGQADLLLSGNSTASETHTGNYDALNGLLLAGDGKGGFRSLSMVESGFYLPGEGRGLLLLQSAKGGALVVAARNNDFLKVFEASGRSRGKQQ